MDARELLLETYAHMPPARILEDLSAEDAERRMAGAPHSIAEIVAHLHFWQEWFRRRCEGKHAPMVERAAAGWPEVTPGAWPRLREDFVRGLEALGALDAGGARDARIAPAIEFPPLAHYTLGDALVHVANHNAHHLGQIILLRQLMGRWPPPSGSWTW
jgi:uncharacterized damage-inducible protein DinB